MIAKQRRQAGFTILELMIATMVFSVILIVVTAGVISFSQRYYKGVVSNSTQKVASNALNEISQTIEFGGSGGAPVSALPAGPNNTQGYCINGRPYYFLLDKEIGTTTQHALVTASQACPASANGMPDLTQSFATSYWNNLSPRELLGDNMRLAVFSISGAGPITTSVKVIYGDDQVLDTTHQQCHGSAGDEFCASASLNTSVTVRL